VQLAYNQPVQCVVLRCSMCVWLATAACYSPKYADCAITCGDKGCPSGLTCIDGYCHAPDDESSICFDGDNDGKRDFEDNCPGVANVNQENEDGDALGDACDPCPVIKDDDIDSDGDGIGGGCDQDPANGGDHVILFETFNAPPQTATNVGWDFIDGEARLSDGSAGGPVSELRFAITATANQTMLVGLTIAMFANDTTGSVGTFDQSGAYACQIVHASNQLQLQDAGGAPIDVQALTQSTLGADILLDQTHYGADYRCSATGFAGSRVEDPSGSTPQTMVEAGLRASDADVHVRYIWIVGKD
jgi:hypothetical protein